MIVPFQVRAARSISPTFLRKFNCYRFHSAALFDQLEQMVVGIIEVDAGAAVLAVQLAASFSVETGIEVDTGAADALEGRIEFRAAQEKGALENAYRVLRC